jgi:hypothetical protein
MFLFIDPPLRPSKEGNFRYSIFFNLLAIIVYRQTLIIPRLFWLHNFSLGKKSPAILRLTYRDARYPEKMVAGKSTNRLRDNRMGWHTVP